MATNINSMQTIDNRVKVKPIKAYISKPVTGGSLWGILISVGMILGGLSGRFVLRGTQSSGALVLVGIVFLVIDIIGYIRANSKKKEATEAEFRHKEKLHEMEKNIKTGNRKLEETVPVILTVEQSLRAMGYGPRINGELMKYDNKEGKYTIDTEWENNIINFNGMDMNATFEVVPGTGPVVIELAKDKESFCCIIFPENVRVTSTNKQ
ncbi:MAG: hypothetical protein K6F83_02755 [Clostridiales bacterium]|nr:hypothetical protein [Clostridiales bacterium]